MIKLKIFFLSFLFFLNYSNKKDIGEPFLQKTIVWEESEDGIFAYFVYGLSVTTRGSILAFAEARMTDGSDDGAHHIVMKRSTDKGVSFSKSQVIVKSDGFQSWANPTVVIDKKTKEIFLFYALNHENRHTDVFYKVSNDDGLNWSEAKSITSLFENNINGWTFHLPGPGHGLQLKDNRLIIPIWHRKSINFPATKRNYGVNCIYSDDDGKNWKVGGETPIGELNESQLVQQKNGYLLLIGRTIKPRLGAYQAKVWSEDGGETWSNSLQYDTALKGKVCDIGLTNYSATTYIISQPVDQNQRKDLSIRVSNDEGKTWPILRTLEAGGATYSDMALLPDKSIVCLYGHGETNRMPQKVSLARFNMEWILGL